MLCRLTNSDSYMADLQVRRVSWQLPFSRSFGQAEVFIPRNSPAHNVAYIAEYGDTLVELFDSRLGDWTGVATGTHTDAAGTTLSPLHIAGQVAQRPVRTGYTVTGMTAGGIVQLAVQDAIAGMSRPFLRPGTFVCAAPVIGSYAFTGQSLDEVLKAMMGYTAAEWFVAANGALSWVPRVGSVYDALLSDDGDLVDGARTVNLDNRVAQLTAVDSGGRTLQETAGENLDSWWPRAGVLSVSTSSPAILAQELHRAISDQRRPDITFAAKLRSQHWASVREGDILQAVLPYAGIQTVCPQVRVLSRSYADNQPHLDLTLQYLPPYSGSIPARTFAESIIPPYVPNSRTGAVLALTDLQIAVAGQRQTIAGLGV